MINLIIASSLLTIIYAEEACCGCTEPFDEIDGVIGCNYDCDQAVCSYDSFCCEVDGGYWDEQCADAAADECDSAHEDYCGCDDGCNCDEICHGNEPEDWEFDYDEVPPCIQENCQTQLDHCAASDPCVSGIEGMVSTCYADNENPQQCMDGLVQDTETNQFNQFCDGNEECGTDLRALGECVVNSANYGFCPEEEYKKLKLKSLLKTVKKRSRKLRRKSVAKKQSSKRSRRGRRRKRGKRQSKLRKSRRKLQEGTEGSDQYEPEPEHYDDENPENDYGCNCNCNEDDDIPQCILDACGPEIDACKANEDCIDGVDAVGETCYENNESPQECMDELMHETNGEQILQLTNGNEEAAGDLHALGQCVITSANYGFCEDEEYKKLKLKGLVKEMKKLKARKLSATRLRSRSARARRQRSQRLRQSRSRRAGLARRQRRARVQRSRRALLRAPRLRRSRRSRRSRRKLMYEEGGCCDYECHEESDEPGCNYGCEVDVCSYDSYCCNEAWDSYCVGHAEDECGGGDDGDEYGSGSYQDSYDYGTGPSGDYGSDSYDYGGYPEDSYDYGSYDDSYYQPSDSYDYGGYPEDSYDYGSDSYYPSDSYDYGGYPEDSYDYGSDSYMPPQRGRRVSRTRALRQRRQRPRSRARVSRAQRLKRSRKRSLAGRQRRARPLRRHRQRLRRL